MALWRVRATVDDRPGFLAVLTASLALRAINILFVQVHPGSAGAVDDFLLDAPDDLDAEDLLAAVERGRGRDAWVRRAESRYLVDPVVDALSAARRVARDPDSLAVTLGGLHVGTASRVASGGTTGPGFGDTWIRVPDPAGGLLLIERAAPPFTAAEYARARALADVAADAYAASSTSLPGTG
jgi:hypothetical protein